MIDSKKKGIPTYETPVLIPLGELAKGNGSCLTGSVPSAAAGRCSFGATAGNTCASGAAAAGGHKCVTGAAG